MHGAGETFGPYRLVARLGSGGMGVVYAAEVVQHAAGLDAGTRVALKVVHPHLLGTPGFLARFRREADIGSRIRDGNVVRVHGAGEASMEGRPVPFLVMEFVEGQTLRALLEELGVVPEELCRHIGCEVARGLAAIHAAGAIHRDLKPDNVIITLDQVVKIMDLGMARLEDQAIRLSNSGAFAGSVLYAAPEQLTARSPDGRADLYALGILLYELASGRHPFLSDDVSEVIQRQIGEEARPVADVNPQLSPYFEELVKTLTAKDRKARIPSAGELARILEEGEDGAWWQARARGIREATRRPLRRIRIPRETSFHGRADELALLEKQFASARAGEGRVVLVEGEAGIGKTRLVHEFATRLSRRNEDFHLLLGTYPPGGAATAAGAFSTAYREHFGEQETEEALARYLTVTPGLIPAFAALLRGLPPPPEARPLDRDSVHTVFVHVSRALALERTTVIVIEDLECAPAEGLALFASLALAAHGHRLLLVGTTRPGLPENWLADLVRLDPGCHLVLPRLAPKELGAMLEEAFHSAKLAEELGWSIALRSDCNPFFAIEIIRGLREGKFITRSEDGSWVRSQVIDRIRIPSSVLDLIQARIADLTEQEKDLLDVAACAGFSFDPVLVGEAVGLGRAAALRSFARIERRHRLVRSEGRRFQFDHHQVQEALYEELPELLREEYHGALATLLEDRGPSPEGVVAVDLCEHFLRSGHPESARRHLDQALDHLGEGYLNDAASRLARRALDAKGLLEGEERLGVLLRLVNRLNLLGRRHEERAALDEARSLADALGGPALRAEVRYQEGRHGIYVSDYEEARRRLEEAAELARAAGDVARQERIAGALGITLAHFGLIEEARTSQEEARALARSRGDREAEARATGNLGHLCWRRGEYGKALRYFEEDRALSREAGDRRSEAQTTQNLGVVCRALGRNEEARAHYERALGLFREVGDRRGEAIAADNLGRVLRDLGAAEEAADCHARSLGLAREIEYRHGVARAALSLGSLLIDGGHPGDARPYLEEALAEAQAIQATGAVVTAAVHLARLPGGDVAHAEQVFAEAVPGLDKQEHLDLAYQLWCLTSRRSYLEMAATVLEELLAGAPEDARKAMVESVRLYRAVREAAREGDVSPPSTRG